ncbi:MAG: cupin domain-containing protein [Planctomycetota bacterium]
MRVIGGVGVSEYFYDLASCPKHDIFPGVSIRTAWLERLMTSVVEFEANAVVEEHSHPHEQMGIVLSGRAVFTVGGETRTLGPGDVYRIPGNIKHKVVALDGPVKAFDVFSPPRDDYK